MRVSTHRVLPAVYLVVFLASSVAGAGAAPPDELSDALRPLAYRLGRWTAVVEWLDADGVVVRTMPSIREVRPVLGGHALEEQGRLVGTPTSVVALIYFDREADRITELGVMAPGNFDRLHATVEPERVTFTAEPRERNGTTVVFRAIDSAFEGDRYETTGWISTDEGKTWRQTFRQVNHRLEG